VPRYGVFGISVPVEELREVCDWGLIREIWMSVAGL